MNTNDTKPEPVLHEADALILDAIDGAVLRLHETLIAAELATGGQITRAEWRGAVVDHLCDGVKRRKRLLRRLAKHRAREAALAKLTVEDRQALGLEGFIGDEEP